LTPISKLAITGTTETRIPKRKEEITSPRNIVLREIGEDIRRSSVLALASQGTIAGPVDVAVKKAVIPSNPGIKVSIGIFRPM
jgi:hypothetical protein